MRLNGKVVTDIELDFSYGATTKSGQDLPLKKERPKLHLVGGDRLISIQDNGINLTTKALLRWEQDLGALQDQVLQVPLVVAWMRKQKAGGSAADEGWDEPRMESVNDLKEVWAQVIKSVPLGQLRHGSFEKKFPQAQQLGDKPRPDVMTHEEFQTGIQSLRTWMERLRAGIRDHVGVATPEASPPTVQAPTAPTPRGKISLARPEPRPLERPLIPPPDRPKISLARPKKPPK